MIRTDDHDGARRIRVLLAIGLVINLVGFVYDWSWHARNLSLEPPPPSKLLTIHSGIYLGAIIAAVAVGQAFARRTFRSGPQRIGLWVLTVGLLLEFLGDATDMYAHGQGYEKDLYHDFIVNGAGLTVLGYLIIELFHMFRGGTAGTRAGEDTPAAREAAGRSGPR